MCRQAAAFGRLCVETAEEAERLAVQYPAAFGRLCVETAACLVARVSWQQPPSGGCVLKQVKKEQQRRQEEQPPSGGCVLKHFKSPFSLTFETSRLRAAVC